MPRILVLGSGMVASPCIEHLARNPNNTITVAKWTNITRQSTQDVEFKQPVEPCKPLRDKHIAVHDVVISLIPCIYHASVIKSVIKSATNVVTTSYASDAIRCNSKLQMRDKAPSIPAPKLAG